MNIVQDISASREYMPLRNYHELADKVPVYSYAGNLSDTVMVKLHKNGEVSVTRLGIQLPAQEIVEDMVDLATEYMKSVIGEQDSYAVVVNKADGIVFDLEKGNFFSDKMRSRFMVAPDKSMMHLLVYRETDKETKVTRWVPVTVFNRPSNEVGARLLLHYLSSRMILEKDKPSTVFGERLFTLLTSDIYGCSEVQSNFDIQGAVTSPKLCSARKPKQLKALKKLFHEVSTRRQDKYYKLSDLIKGGYIPYNVNGYVENDLNIPDVNYFTVDIGILTAHTTSTALTRQTLSLALKVNIRDVEVVVWAEE